MLDFTCVSKTISRMHSKNWSLLVEVLLYFDNYPKCHFRKDKLFRRSLRCFEIVNETEFFPDPTTHGLMKVSSGLKG